VRWPCSPARGPVSVGSPAHLAQRGDEEPGAEDGKAAHVGHAVDFEARRVVDLPPRAQPPFHPAVAGEPERKLPPDDHHNTPVAQPSHAMNPLRLLGAAQTARPRQAARGRACFMKKKLVQAAMVASANTSSATHLSGLVRGHPLYTAAKPARARGRRLGAAPRSCRAPQCTGIRRVQPCNQTRLDAHTPCFAQGDHDLEGAMPPVRLRQRYACALQPGGAGTAPGCIRSWRRRVQPANTAEHEERRVNVGPEQVGMSTGAPRGPHRWRRGR